MRYCKIWVIRSSTIAIFHCNELFLPPRDLRPIRSGMAEGLKKIKKKKNKFTNVSVCSLSKRPLIKLHFLGLRTEESGRGSPKGRCEFKEASRG